MSSALTTSHDGSADRALTNALSAAAAGRQDEAERWFASACYADEWECGESGQTRSEARELFARWCDEHDRPGQALALRQMLVDEASRDSLMTASWIRSGARPYSDALDCARSREWARHRAVCALLDGMPVDALSARERLLTILGDNYNFGVDSERLVRAHLLTTPGGARFRGQLRWAVLGERCAAGTEDVGEADAGADGEAAAAVLWWLARDFQSSWLDLLGLPEEAELLRRTLDAGVAGGRAMLPESVPQPKHVIRVLEHIDEMRPASDVISEKVDGMGDLRGSSLDSLELRGKPMARWARELGLGGAPHHIEGPRDQIPALRGTPLGWSLRLARLRGAGTALQHVGWVLDEAFEAASTVLERREVAVSAGAIREELAAERRAHDMVKAHLREQRAVLEELVERLTS